MIRHEDGIGISYEIFMAKGLRFYLEHNWQSTVLKSCFWKVNSIFSLQHF